MNETNCEKFLMAKMALLDGEKTEISVETIEAHFAVCETCRAEFEQMRVAHVLLKRQTRLEAEADLWSAIEEKIGVQKTASVSWKLFVLFGAVLLGYKFFQMFSAQNLVLIFDAAALILIAALFFLLKENPFKINAELELEK